MSSHVFQSDCLPSSGLDQVINRSVDVPSGECIKVSDSASLVLPLSPNRSLAVPTLSLSLSLPVSVLSPSRSPSVPRLSPSRSFSKKARLSFSGPVIGFPDAVGTDLVVSDCGIGVSDPAFDDRDARFDVSDAVFGISDCVMDESDAVFDMSDSIFDVCECVLVEVRPRGLIELGVTVQLKHEVISSAPKLESTGIVPLGTPISSNLSSEPVKDCLIPNLDVLVPVPDI
jgi:hypothetical protein